MILLMLAAVLNGAPHVFDVQMENLALPDALTEVAHATGWHCSAARGSSLRINVEARDISKDELLNGFKHALTASGFDVVEEGGSCLVMQQAGKPHARSVQLARMNGKWLVRPGPAQ